MIFPSGQERPAPWGMEYSQDQGSAIRGGQDHRVAIRGGQDLEVAITKYEVRDFLFFCFFAFEDQESERNV